MKLTFFPYTLKLKHPFSIAHHSRTTTPVILTEIEHEGKVVYGEASLPQYLGETQKSVADFLSKIDLIQFKDPFQLDEIIDYVDSIEKGNNAAKASIDIALHDLFGKLHNQPLYNYFGFGKAKAFETSFTIGIDKPEMIRKKVSEAEEFRILKVKLGTENDEEIINTIRSVTDKLLFVDVNQGWKDKNIALEKIHWLSEQNVLLVEQPLPVEQIDDIAWLTERSPLLIIADEAVKRLPDVNKAKGVYSGINIKLMKSTGIREAKLMIDYARKLGLKIIIGCMTETSCAISAASHLALACDWADLDGNLLSKNDPFEGPKVIDGKLHLSDRPGIGVIKK